MGQLDAVKQYIAAKGCACREGLAESYYLSLKTMPFLLLCGHGDRDMTALPRLFAEAVGAEYLCLQVPPDWQDASDLFGHLDIAGRFVPGPVIDFARRARQTPQKLYFLCLAGVLLDRAEYYLRPILNTAESLGTETPLPLVTMAYYGRDTAAIEAYGELPWPENLYMVATVNMDDASRPIQQQLLDRVYTLDYPEDGLTPCGEDTHPAAVAVQADFLRPCYRQLQACDPAALMAYFKIFEELNKLLMPAKAYMGYRLRNDAVLYLMHAKASGLSELQALDHMIGHKLLSRVQGSAKNIEPVLEALTEPCRCYPQTSEKLRRMRKDCQENGYAAFWD